MLHRYINQTQLYDAFNNFTKQHSSSDSQSAQGLHRLVVLSVPVNIREPCYVYATELACVRSLKPRKGRRLVNVMPASVSPPFCLIDHIKPCMLCPIIKYFTGRRLGSTGPSEVC
ncbi:hypothetical protein LENED_005602 [Lentinula edodes]|uniref:Uncharacterized protein n=1 Tax=Lentinula edodes TaxID=5353 RepID=A0A1Q3E9F4_LENED|nr:hypothetical protein LENED_005602 [Lentinula edodes]